MHCAQCTMHIQCKGTKLYGTIFVIIKQQTRSPSVMSTKLPQPEIQVIKLHKNANGMGLSIVAAKGSGQVIKRANQFID